MIINLKIFKTYIETNLTNKYYQMKIKKDNK